EAASHRKLKKKFTILFGFLCFHIHI
ncbi:hypothetical protein TNCT_194411, partial [Trichonephila clavata]